MKGFDRITESSLTTERLIVNTESYKMISSESNMSIQDASEFIAEEFEKAHEDLEYNLLLSEVFGRSESEISIDFKMNDRLSSILEKFKDEKWQSLDDDEKITIIKEFTNKLGIALGLDSIPSIEISDESKVQGSYSPDTNTIVISSKDIDNPYEIVDTIPHELRHAYQHMRAEMMDTYEDVLYRVNIDNYINPKQLIDGSWLFFTDYYDQYVEVDARAFARIFTEALK